MAVFYMVCFDIRDDRRLRRVSDELENFGQRVQRSVFECWLDEKDRQALQAQLRDVIDPAVDQVRFYSLCPKDVHSVLVAGPGSITVDPDFHMV
jgi:CRISPR-associated protein Cas2